MKNKTDKRRKKKVKQINKSSINDREDEISRKRWTSQVSRYRVGMSVFEPFLY